MKRVTVQGPADRWRSSSILALAACAAPPAAPAPAAAPTQAPPRPRPPRRPRPDAKPSVYKVGLINHLTGDAAAYGQSMKKGTELALDVINGAGGIGGTKVEVIYEDDRLSAADAQTAFLKLVQSDKVPAIMGSGASSISLSLCPKAQEMQDRPDLQHLDRAEPEGLRQVLLLRHGFRHRPGPRMGQGRGSTWAPRKPRSCTSTTTTASASRTPSSRPSRRPAARC